MLNMAAGAVLIFSLKDAAVASVGKRVVDDTTTEPALMLLMVTALAPTDAAVDTCKMYSSWKVALATGSSSAAMSRSGNFTSETMMVATPAVGEAVGELVGDLVVGEAVGKPVGDKVAPSKVGVWVVGEEVGEEVVGETVGGMVGGTVGLLVGALIVGEAVVTVGEKVAPSKVGVLVVGEEVGEEVVGESVGGMVGGTVGLLVGALVVGEAVVTVGALVVGEAVVTVGDMVGALVVRLNTVRRPTQTPAMLAT